MNTVLRAASAPSAVKSRNTPRLSRNCKAFIVQILKHSGFALRWHMIPPKRAKFPADIPSSVAISVARYIAYSVACAFISRALVPPVPPGHSNIRESRVQITQRNKTRRLKPANTTPSPRYETYGATRVSAHNHNKAAIVA